LPHTSSPSAAAQHGVGGLPHAQLAGEGEHRFGVDGHGAHAAVRLNQRVHGALGGLGHQRELAALQGCVDARADGLHPH